MIKITIEEVKKNLVEKVACFEAQFKLSELNIENNDEGQLELDRLEKIAKKNDMEFWFDFGDDNIIFTLED